MTIDYSEWHETLEAAKARVRVIIAAKRKSLIRVVSKLDSLSEWLDEG